MNKEEGDRNLQKKIRMIAQYKRRLYHPFTFWINDRDEGNMIMIDAIAVSAIFTYLAKQKLQSHQEERFFKWV